jgi:Fe2+ transport system protein FeoA
MLPGQTGFISSIKNTDETFYRLSELGLIEGQRVTFLKRAPLGDPIEIRIMNYDLCLRNSEASQIEVNLEMAKLI